MTRDMLRIDGSRKPHMSISVPHGSGACVCPSETRLLVLENRLRQTEEALVAERRASRRTEVAEQVVGTCPAGVDVEGIWRLEMFSRDSDLNSRVNRVPWSQWSLTVRSYFGEFNQTGDPVAAAGGNKTWKIRSSPTTRR